MADSPCQDQSPLVKSKHLPPIARKLVWLTRFYLSSYWAPSQHKTDLTSKSEKCCSRLQSNARPKRSSSVRHQDAIQSTFQGVQHDQFFLAIEVRRHTRRVRLYPRPPPPWSGHRSGQRAAACALILLALSVGGQRAHSAQIADDDFSSALAQAKLEGVAFVSVTVMSITLAQAAGADPAKLAVLRANERQLLEELGPDVWPEGQTNNRLGQLGLLVTPAGMHKLRASTRAEKFAAAVHPRLRAHRVNPEFRELEAALLAGQDVPASLRLRNEAAEIAIDRKGELQTSGGLAAASEHAARSGRVVAALRAHAARIPPTQRVQIPDPEQPQAALSDTNLQLRLNRQTLLAAVIHPDVASIRAATTEPARPPVVHPQVMQVARQHGFAQVLLLMKDPTRQAEMTSSELARATAAKRSAMADMQRTHGLRSKLNDLSAFGVFGATLRLDELERLTQSADPRLAGIDLSRPVAEPALNRSVPRMNLASVWSAGFQGTYPFPIFPVNPTEVRPIRIAVLDTGVVKDHPMLLNKLPAVGYEACFGTNSNLFARRSICRGAPLPTPGNPATYGSFSAIGTHKDGEPPMQVPPGLPSHPYCTTRSTTLSMCDHGTFVASIAAGSSVTLNSSPPPLQDAAPLIFSGVAPQAQIVPIQIMSWDSVGPSLAPGMFVEDLLAALNAIKDESAAVQDLLTNADPQQAAQWRPNDWVINISAGGGAYSNPCQADVPPAVGYNPPAGSAPPTSQAVADAIFILKQTYGIPTIISAGNDNETEKLAWPACLPHAIKASSLSNIPGLQHHVAQSVSNKIPLGQGTPYFGEQFFVAAGGGVYAQQAGPVYAATAITRTNGWRYHGDAGTSFAAPHVAGAYALVKAGYRKLGEAWEVDHGSAYLQGTASTDAVWVNPDPPYQQRTYRSIRFVPVN